jgi:hypothetical protein
MRQLHMKGTMNHFSAPLAWSFPAASAVAVLLFSCAADFSSIKPGIDERGHYIEGVPFYHQDENQSGPAVLAGIVTFWEGIVDVEGWATETYLAQLKGTLPEDIENYLRGTGFDTVSMAGTMKTLTAYVRQNIPVISLLEIGFGSYRIPHYVTVIGFDDVKRLLILHDGITQNKVITYDSFIRYWSRAGFWMMVAVPVSLKERSDRRRD